MDVGNTTEDQQDAGNNSTLVIDSMDADTKDDVATVSAVTPVSCGLLAVGIDEISLILKDEIKVETSIENLSQEENVTSIPNSTSEERIIQNKIAEVDISEVEIGTIKPNTLAESATTKEESSQERAISGNTDLEVGVRTGENIEGSANAETVKNVAVPAIIESQDDQKTTHEEASGEKKVEGLATEKDVQEPAVPVDKAKATQEEARAKTSGTEDVVAAVDEGAVTKTIEIPADGEESSRSLEMSVASSADENTPASLCLLAGDHEQCPVSPPSEKEVDQSDDNPLHIDESCASHSEDAAGTAHTSSATEPVALGDKEETSMLCDKTGEIVKDLGYRKEAVSKEEGTLDKSTTASKTSCSIEDSIERCIANHMSECAENDAPSISPPKKRCVTTTAKPVESEKFPRNYGFKIITNKINLCSSKPALTIMPKLDASGIPLKKIKIKAQTISESIFITQDKEEKNSELASNALPKGVTIAIRKSTDESEPSPPKERPTLGLKVRNVESINAGIRTVKAPVCPELPEDVNKTVDAANSVNENLAEQEVTNAVTGAPPEVEPEPLQAAKKLGRLIAPKCEPIASNDQQAVKHIRDLIQLSSMPVYVPDVSDSKHFNGRLHLCHGCGDRFVLLKSLLEHQNRRSCVIKFQCLKCDSNVLRFFNRCEFIRHLYNHNQTLTNVMVQYHIVVERLPACNTGIFDVTACPECKAVLKVPLSEHMQALDVAEKRTPDLVLKCQWCSLLLPTKCAYQAHRRMHFLQGPHVCPECGETSPDLSSFNYHINSMCFHTSKRSLFVCPQCQVEMYDATKLERHIRHKHIRDVFKCNFCFVACFNMKDLDKHRRQHHEERVVEEEDDDETGLKYAFHLCDMCPNRLIRRIRLGQHVWDHAYTNNEVTYVYECRKCKVGFYSRDTLSGHSLVCTAPATAANAPAFATVIANGGDIVVEQSACTSAGVFVVEGPPCGFDFNEIESEGVARIQGDEPTLDTLDEREAPPPLKKAPVTLKVRQSSQPSAAVVKPPSQAIPQSAVPPGAAPKVRIMSKTLVQVSSKPGEASAGPPERKKKATPQKSAAKPEVVTPQLPALNDDNSFNSFESELFMDADDPDAGEGAMEVVLNCLECGTNLTSELGSYCTLCQQKREAGSQTFKTAALANSLPPGPAKKKVPKKFPISGGNFTCRICNELISRTCDRAAIKRHFITKHKEIFIAALQSGMNANPNGPKLSRPNILTHKPRAELTTSPKNGPGVPVNKVAKKKKKARKQAGGQVSQSDTDDSAVSTSPAKDKEGKKAKDKRKRTYSPTFPALEEGMVASEDKGTENRENMRFCYKCPFQSSDKDEFMTHVATHKTNPKDLQCPACGMGFVVRPSLEKHLVILHGMKNVYAYLLEHGFPPVEKSSEDVDTEMLDINQCRVCHSKFDSEAMLEKHFRTHGSAFLLSKQFRRS